jgi:hypothetical protein
MRTQFSISNFRAQILGDDVALVTYQAVRREEPNHSGLASLRSSLWVIRDGQWRMLFHQGTTVPEN